MGRSVDYLTNARHKTFLHDLFNTKPCCDVCGSSHVSSIEDDDRYDCTNYQCDECGVLFEWHEDYADFEWDYFEEGLTELLSEKAPSLDILTGKNKRWDGRETSIIAENNFCEIGLSEYCGFVSVSIRVIEDNYVHKYEKLAERWIDKIWPKIEAAMLERYGKKLLRKIGSFSNGEGVYESVKY